MKQIFYGWTIAAKVTEMFKTRTYFMGIDANSPTITLEAYPTHVNVLKNLHKTKEDAIKFWKSGLWDSCVDRESISILPVKIKVEIDVACLGLDWNGI